MQALLKRALPAWTQSWTASQARGFKSVSHKIYIELLQDVPGLGSAGEIAQASAGYVRNYLQHKQLARPLPKPAGLQGGGQAARRLREHLSQGSPAQQEFLKLALEAGPGTGASVLHKHRRLPRGAAGALLRERRAAAAAGSGRAGGALSRREQEEATVKKLLSSAVLVRRRSEDGVAVDPPVGREDVTLAVAKQLRIELHPDALDIGDESIDRTGQFELPLKILSPQGDKVRLSVSVVAR